ncbi:MAG: hypothetical protein JO105_20875 [Hyphomicrobiales bacterium]|nr:hypothetical protein [Hyphomicrobiales bacterium]
MNNAESGIPPHAIADINRSLSALAEATKQQMVATLTAAIIIASGKPRSIAEVLEIAHDIQFATHPAPNVGAYQEWAKTKDARLRKVHE